MHNAEGTATQIDGTYGEGLVHGIRKYPARKMPRFVPSAFLTASPKTIPTSSTGVVLVHMQISVRVQIQIERAMPGHEFHHVIEETYSRAHARFAAAV